MATIRENVESILEKSRRARNDDKYLLAMYWHDVDQVLFPMTGKDFVNLATTPASIIRARALIQADGMYESDAATKARRAEREEAHRKSLGQYNELPEDAGLE